jgi:meiotically up-regulated gene 157 (Mug157) protein
MDSIMSSSEFTPDTLVHPTLTRRGLMKGAAVFTVGSSVAPALGLAATDATDATLPEARPKAAERKFKSEAVEETITSVRARIGDPNLAVLFANCFPNTLDTTVYPGTHEGKPDTHVVTGDIDAMWLRDSSAQVWPYLPLLKKDAQLRELVEGVIRRQGRLIRLDPYANAFLHHTTDKPLSWAVDDKTKHIPGVGERKWEIDSLCYPIRLAHGYWKAAGDTKPFDSDWGQTAWLIVKTFREQQRKNGPGPYSFQRSSPIPTDTVPLSGFGNPARPVGMIYSMFRPSDDACIYPLFVPANLFAVVSLRQLAELATEALQDAKLASECHALADEVEHATKLHGMTRDAKQGEIWAYEVDGFGNVLKMDDANAPGLLSLAYLGCCAIDDPLYRRTRAFTLSENNPYFFKGTAGEGIGGPHEGLGMIWPMSIMIRALTAERNPAGDAEVRQCLKLLRDTTAGTGFMHETFQKDDPKEFTRPWFAWANTLFGELILKLSVERPGLLAGKLG